MPSELDLQLKAILDRLTAAGGFFETEWFERDGVRLPVFKHAPATLPAMFDEFCQGHGAAEFLVDGEVRLTFAQVHELARQVAAGLIGRHGVRRGDRVGIAARNSANWIIAYMGVLMAGGCATLLNGWWSGEELAGGIALAECTLVLADPPRAVRLEGREQGARIVTFDHGSPHVGLAEVLADSAAQLPELTGDHIATIVFTSGSTGTAKGAFSDHRAVVQATLSFAAQSLVAFTQLAAAGTPAVKQQSALVSVPLFHVTGEVALFLQSIVTGRRLVIMPRWDAGEALRLIERERISYFVGVPLMSMEIANHPERDRHDLSSCAIFAAGGAPRPPEQVATLRSVLPHAYPLQGYGLTETNCVGATNVHQNYIAKPGSSGPASRPLVEIAIIGPSGEHLPAGLRGEVAVRSVCNFRGYWRNPQETAAAIRPDGFVMTGDLGYLDDDDYLFIVDRKKDIIIRGGENIASVEVEQALYSHPAVAEASVFGLPHPHYGEVPVAVYSAHDGRSVSEDELHRHLGARVAAFKIPVRFWREDHALPRLGTQKIDKRALKVRYSQAWEAAKAAR